MSKEHEVYFTGEKLIRKIHYILIFLKHHGMKLSGILLRGYLATKYHICMVTFANGKAIIMLCIEMMQKDWRKIKTHQAVGLSLQVIYWLFSRHRSYIHIPDAKIFSVSLFFEY